MTAPTSTNLPESWQEQLSRPWIERDGLMRELRASLETDSAWRLGGVRIQSIYERWESLAREHLGRAPTKVMDFGAGMYHPLAYVALFWVRLGATGVAVELDTRFRRQRAAKALADTLFEVWSEAGEECRSRITAFDIPALRRGEWSNAPAPGVSRFCGDVRKLADSGFDYVFSQSVLEHVDEFDDVIMALGEKTASGGVHAHVIDFRDHRAYGQPERSIWDFLCEENPDGPYCNRLRVSQVLAAYENAGFEILQAKNEQMEMPDAVRSRLLPRYAQLSDDDLKTHASRLIVRKRS